MLQRLMESSALRWLFIAVAVGFGLVALIQYGSDVRAAAGELHWPVVLGALALGIAGTFLPLMSWRALLAGFGSPLPVQVGMRVFLLAQLGKYVPGSIWPFVAQVELGREHGVPPRRSITVGLLTVAVALIVGLTVAALTLPLVSADAARRYWWILCAAPLLLGALHPAILNRLLGVALRLARRPALESPLTLRTIVVTAAWSAVAWLVSGAQITVLALDVGASGPTTYIAATGAYALAWSVGFLVVFAPAGLGVREVALTAGLAPVLGTGEVLVVVIASRLLLTVADLLLAGMAVLLARRHVGARPDELDEAAAAREAARGPARGQARPAGPAGPVSTADLRPTAPDA